MGTVGLPAKYGGFETLAEQLIKCPEIDWVVYCSGKAYEDRSSNFAGAELHYIPFSANGIQSVIYDGLSLLHSCLRGYRAVLVLGVSGAIFIPIVKILRPGLKVIVNIDGVEWRRDKWTWLAKSFLRLSERVAVRSANVLISDNQAISSYISSEYGVSSNTIAYGGDHAFFECSARKHGENALALSRIEPENNVHMILSAFSRTRQKLIYIGNWRANSYGRKLYSQFSESKNIMLLDPVYDLRRLAELRWACAYYVHGHSAGGTNPSLVEMMFFAKPIVAFDCDYNRVTLDGKGQYFSDEESLVRKICSMQGGSEALDLAELARQRYTWSLIQQQYSAVLSNDD